jgi:hypothetical protein
MKMSEEKHVVVTEANWKKLWLKKIEENKSSMDAVITELLEQKPIEGK